jgi:hypothetical protein
LLSLIQHWFVHAKVYSTISQELASRAADVAELIAYRNKWDLTGYRNASPPVPSWFVVSEDGLIIENCAELLGISKAENAIRGNSPLFEITGVLGRLNHAARFIGKANHSIMRN